MMDGWISLGFVLNISQYPAVILKGSLMPKENGGSREHKKDKGRKRGG